MSISTRSRVALTLLVAVLSFAIILAAVLAVVVFPAFASLERSDAIQNLDRVSQAIRREMQFLTDFSRDWAHWDDTYFHSVSRNENFHQSSLTEDVTENVPADIIAIFTADGTPRLLAAYRTAKPYSAEAMALLAPEGQLFRTIVRPLLDPASGPERQETAILRLGGRPLLAVGHAILKSDRSGPAQGVFVMAGIFDADDQRAVEAQTLVDFDLHDVGSAPVLPLPPAEQFRTSDDDEGRVEVVDQQRLRLTVRFKTADGGAFVASSDYAREMTAQGRRALALAAIIASACFVGLVLAIYRGLLVRAFLAPLAAVESQLRRIEGQHDVAARLPEQNGASELRQLARAFNGMMAKLQADQDEIAALSLTDALTELANRRQFDQVFDREFARAQRQELPIALLLIDVDHFKLFNDHYGHVAGDACLQQIAQVLRQTLARGSDLQARYGGEEFVAVLLDTEVEGACRSAERLLQAVRGKNLEHASHGSNAATVTVSIGVRAGVPSGLESAKTWLEQADAALYRAKNEGRNRYTLSQV